MTNLYYAKEIKNGCMVQTGGDPIFRPTMFVRALEGAAPQIARPPQDVFSFGTPARVVPVYWLCSSYEARTGLKRSFENAAHGSGMNFRVYEYDISSRAYGDTIGLAREVGKGEIISEGVYVGTEEVHVVTAELYAAIGEKAVDVPSKVEEVKERFVDAMKRMPGIQVFPHGARKAGWEYAYFALVEAQREFEMGWLTPSEGEDRVSIPFLFHTSAQRREFQSLLSGAIGNAGAYQALMRMEQWEHRVEEGAVEKLWSTGRGDAIFWDEWYVYVLNLSVPLERVHGLLEKVIEGARSAAEGRSR